MQLAGQNEKSVQHAHEQSWNQAIIGTLSSAISVKEDSQAGLQQEDNGAQYVEQELT